MGIRGYQKYTMHVLIDDAITWGGSGYNQLALGGDITVPSGIGADDYTEVTSINQPAATGVTFTERFLIPNVFDALTIVDGTLSGTIKLATAYTAQLLGTGTLDITKAELEVIAVNSAGSERTINTKAEIWTGSIETTETIDELISQQIIFMIQMEEAELLANEKIALDFTITYDNSNSASGRSYLVRLYATVGTDEMTTTLPFIM